MSLKNRREFLFIYDVTNGNPNGDPLDENKPRIDSGTGRNFVTDVRLKRTVRDYLSNFKGEEIFVITKYDSNGNRLKAEDRAEDFNKGKETIIQKCIDIRLFGGTITIKENKAKKKNKNDENNNDNDNNKDSKTITFTGPVQIKFGSSLHKVEINTCKGTTVLATKKESAGGSFRNDNILPYSLIAFYIIVNENNAKHTNLSEEDLELFKEGLWFGTKNLITRSKIEHNPRFLLELKYKEGCFSHIGNLDKFIKLETHKDELEIRNTEDYILNIEKLIEKIKDNQGKIEKINYCLNDIKLSTDNLQGWEKISWEV